MKNNKPKRYLFIVGTLCLLVIFMAVRHIYAETDKFTKAMANVITSVQQWVVIHNAPQQQCIQETCRSVCTTSENVLVDPFPPRAVTVSCDDAPVRICFEGSCPELIFFGGFE